MTLANPHAECPLACDVRNQCISAFSKNRADADDIARLQKALATADVRIAELERSLILRTESADVAREQAVVKTLQKIDVGQRKTIDNLAGETYELRNIMRSKGLDMAEVQTRVTESLAKYRLAIEEDR